jgi:hypothetical protein
VKKIIRYVTGNCNWELWFDRKKRNHVLLTGLSDDDFAEDFDASKSTKWVIFFLVNSPIT